ncbi:MAG: tRNA (adenosine(37)-N6)-threonylcarbamoyltransferase complex dimerization subunit type 1 TsaB [Ruminococcaceae bacterium]|nr:tRNA (adenosine(37)-N6)-threonylcarbamoyltransferase complex dimerization subunit type 1 TsaB [Oscillospiraceae bacterium]
MKILALDSSACVGTVALCEDEKLICELTTNTGNTHSETLLPTVEQILKLTDTAIDDIDLFACSVGPGSFTGVRIGVATVKGIAFGKNKPCVGISTLDSLARNIACFEGILCPVMDARRDHVYNALYECSNGKVTRLCDDRLISVCDLDRELSSLSEKIYLCGDGYGLCEKKFNSAKIEFTPQRLCLESAYSAALVALEKYRNGEFVSDFELAPVYLRPSQAERERNEKLKG